MACKHGIQYFQGIFAFNVNQLPLHNASNEPIRYREQHLS